MELILINSEKLKIILTDTDMIKLNISADRLNYGNSSTKRVLWELLDEAKRSLGFDTDNAKLDIQVFVDKRGGCEMFITKAPKKDPLTKVIQGKKFKASYGRRAVNGIYITVDFPKLCEICKRLKNSSSEISTDLYKSPSGEYILFIKFTNEDKDDISSKFKLPQYVFEYGKASPITEKAIAFAREHCDKIREGDAVGLIASL